MFNIQHLIDETKCFAVICELRWPEGVKCPHCQASAIRKRGFHTTQTACQRYACQKCGKQFDDLTNTIFEGHHQPLQVWVLCLYLMGLNLSNAQIAAELDVAESVAQEMTTQLREAVMVKKSPSN